MSSDLDEDMVLSLEKFHDFSSSNTPFLTTTAISTQRILLLLLLEEMVWKDLSGEMLILISEEIVGALGDAELLINLQQRRGGISDGEREDEVTSWIS